MAAPVFTQARPMDRAMTIRLAAARSRVACLSCSLVSVISRCARWLKMTVAWVARLAASKLNAKMSTASGLAEYLPSRLLVNADRWSGRRIRTHGDPADSTGI